MSSKITFAGKWQSLWPFHKKNIWERFEPLWFSLIAIVVVSIIALGLRTAISYQIVGEEKLYISPSSYSLETDFFDEINPEELAFDPFIIPAALAETDAEKIKIIIK
ncbi:MAG: hypothetical protein GY793_06260 [Proteobacteria bacterium]|nr:hypothetical protein [Pseudomonadota bacterium]